MIIFLKILGWLFIGGSILFLILSILGMCRMAYDINHSFKDIEESENEE